jgi:hypothetical protein
LLDGPGQWRFPGNDVAPVWPLGEGFRDWAQRRLLAMIRPARAYVPDGKTIHAKVTRFS